MRAFTVPLAAMASGGVKGGAPGSAQSASALLSVRRADVDDVVAINNLLVSTATTVEWSGVEWSAVARM